MNIHKDVKEQLRQYACMINEKQDAFLIIVKFPVLAGVEQIQFYIGGKITIKDSIDEAICFLDGLNVATDFYVKTAIIEEGKKEQSNPWLAPGESEHSYTGLQG